MTEKLWRLRGVEGPHTGEFFLVSHRTVLGRGAGADVQVVDTSLSRQHAVIFEREDGAMVLMDLSSTNGTWVGDKQVSMHLLNPGDVFRLGNSRFAFEQRDEFDAVTSKVVLVSGLAQLSTRVYKSPVRTTECDHAQGLANGYAFCPLCGQAIG